MGKNKLAKFEENLNFSNLFQLPACMVDWQAPWKGKWKENYFKNNNPLILEVGCGKGEYTVELARKHADRNYIGMDIKGARLWRGCKTAEENAMQNVAFLRTKAEFLDRIFAPKEVSEIWVTFPDPQPNKENKRLTSPAFLERYAKILDTDGIIHLKTDDTALYEYTFHQVVEKNAHIILDNTSDLYAPEETYREMMDIQTFYEKRWLQEGKKIKYISFRLRK
ncbi:MAG: tRNA (guanosine(46)-N7)-methyltransferase TrmB [Bacteroidales bacterium]